MFTSWLLQARRLGLYEVPVPGHVTSKETWKMKMRMKIIAVVPAVLAAAVVLMAAPAFAAGGHTGFGFNATGISGFPAGAASLTGGGSFNPGTGFANGIDESFTAQMIVSAGDIAPDIAGTQNVWIQGVGCAPAIANFSS